MQAPEPENDEIDYDAIRSRVEKRVRRRMQTLQQLGGFLTVNLMLWGIWAVTGAKISNPWPIWVTLFWGVAVVGNLVRDYLNSGVANFRDREIEREIARERDQAIMNGDPGLDDDVAVEKPKRKPHYELGDDGELIQSDSDETAKQKRDAGLLN